MIAIEISLDKFMLLYSMEEHGNCKPGCAILQPFKQNSISRVPLKIQVKSIPMDTEFIPKSAMTIQAHPDDQEFAAAGTLAKWAKAGCEIVSVLVTSGDSGSNDPSKGPEYKTELAQLREAEQRAANKVLGVRETVFLRHPDGEVVASIGLRMELTRLIRKFKPEVVLCGDPSSWFFSNEYVNHPDHRATAEAAVTATFPSAGSRLIFPHDVEKWIYEWAGSTGKEKGIQYAEAFRVMLLKDEEDKG